MTIPEFQSHCSRLADILCIEFRSISYDIAAESYEETIAKGDAWNIVAHFFIKKDGIIFAQHITRIEELGFSIMLDSKNGLCATLESETFEREDTENQLALIAKRDGEDAARLDTITHQEGRAGPKVGYVPASELGDDWRPSSHLPESRTKNNVNPCT